MHLFSGTARRRKLLLAHKWKPCAYVHFVISERGKTRPIDAPRIQDTDTGRVIVNGNRDGVKRARRKIKAFKNKIERGEMTYEDLWTSVNGILAYFGAYDDHNRVLRLRRLFYSIYGFSPEHIENFRRQGVTNEIHNASEIQGRSNLWKSEYSSYV